MAPLLVATPTTVFVWGGQQGDELALGDGATFELATRRWTRLPSAPLLPRYGASAVWTGSQFLVWGGMAAYGARTYDDGAAYDPQAKTWTRLPRAPLRNRAFHLSVWTGREMLVWGGFTLDRGLAVHFDDGAAYRPDSRSWHRLPRAPLRPGSGLVGVWTGAQMLILGGVDSNNRPFADGAAYDTRTSRWTSLPPMPGGGWLDLTGDWNGQALLVWGGTKSLGASPVASGAVLTRTPDGWSWTPVGGSDARTAQTVTGVPGGWLVLGGRTQERVFGNIARIEPPAS